MGWFVMLMMPAMMMQQRKAEVTSPAVALQQQRVAGLLAAVAARVAAGPLALLGEEKRKPTRLGERQRKHHQRDVKAHWSRLAAIGVLVPTPQQLPFWCSGLLLFHHIATRGNHTEKTETRGGCRRTTVTP